MINWSLLGPDRQGHIWINVVETDGNRSSYDLGTPYQGAKRLQDFLEQLGFRDKQALRVHGWPR